MNSHDEKAIKHLYGIQRRHGELPSLLRRSLTIPAYK